MSRMGVPSSMSTPRTCRRLRSRWRAGCKYAVRPIVGWRGAQQLEAFGAVEFPDHDEMGEAFDVGEPQLKLRQDPEYSFCLVFGPQSLGDFPGFPVGTTHKSNRLWCKHEKSEPPLHLRCG